MACKGCLECLLKLLNFLLTLLGLAMVGYGIYLFVEYKHATSTDPSIGPSSDQMIQLGRPLLMAVSMSGSIFDNLPKAWFIYLFVGLGVIVFVISCFGCIGAATRNGCCLSCYSVLVILLILVELGVAAFIFFDKSWKDEIPTDRTGDFDMIYGFLVNNWKIVKWVALGAVILEALVFLLALLVRAANKPADYDSDDEYIGGPRQQLRQQLINNRPPVPPTGVPVAGTLDQRPSRSDTWSTRMREKVSASFPTANRGKESLHNHVIIIWVSHKFEIGCTAFWKLIFTRTLYVQITHFFWTCFQNHTCPFKCNVVWVLGL